MSKNSQILDETAFKQVVKDIIKEEIEKGNIDESFLSNLGRGITGAFGTGNSKSAKYGPTNAFGNIKRRAQSMKVGFQTGQNVDKIKTAIKALQNLIDNKEIVGNVGNKTYNSIQQTLRLLQMSTGRQNASAMAYRNRIQ